MHSSHPGAGRKAFTLIELLVVIAIIAILAAILFPVFAQARAKARQATAASNFKQVVTAALMYIQDYDEVWPIALPNNGVTNAAINNVWTVPDSALAPPPASPQSHSMWANTMQPYMKNYTIYNTPAHTDLFLFQPPPAGIQGQTRMALYYNGYLNCWNYAGTPSPASTIAFTEGGKNAPVGYTLCFPMPTVNGCGQPTQVPYQFSTALGPNGAGDCGFTFQTSDNNWWVHSQGTHMVYMDGHVKWVRHSSSNSPFAAVGPDGKPTGSIWVSHGCIIGTEACFYYWHAPSTEK